MSPVVRKRYRHKANVKLFLFDVREEVLLGRIGGNIYDVL
jgi:ATP-dependent RNA circularization protein (DNA/RNA ligase family)